MAIIPLITSNSFSLANSIQSFKKTKKTLIHPKLQEKHSEASKAEGWNTQENSKAAKVQEDRELEGFKKLLDSSLSPQERDWTRIPMLSRTCLPLTNSLSFWNILDSRTWYGIRANTKSRIRIPIEVLFLQVTWVGTYHFERRPIWGGRGVLSRFVLCFLIA